MPENIERLLHRRPDLSTFLVHLTRNDYGPEGSTARQNLLSMLTSRSIEARSVFGMAKAWAAENPDVAATQRCVCFTETPLEQVWMMTREINLRQIQMQPYGIAFTKRYGRRSRVNPVWYVDITPMAGHSWLTNPINVMVELARRGEGRTLESPPPDVTGAIVVCPNPSDEPILRITPFVEQMGPTGLAKKEFWWEREWRRVGDFNFPGFNWPNVVAAFVPEDDHVAFWNDLATADDQNLQDVKKWLPLLDPEWGLERMIARLAGVHDDHAGPFT